MLNHVLVFNLAGSEDCGFWGVPCGSDFKLISDFLKAEDTQIINFDANYLRDLGPIIRTELWSDGYYEVVIVSPLRARGHVNRNSMSIGSSRLGAVVGVNRNSTEQTKVQLKVQSVIANVAFSHLIHLEKNPNKFGSIWDDWITSSGGSVQTRDECIDRIIDVLKVRYDIRLKVYHLDYM